MKTNKFGIVSSVISILVLICTFAFDFIKFTMGSKSIGITAWNTNSGGDEIFAKGIQNETSAGTLILLVVILLVVNIIVQFIKSGKLAVWVNSIVSIVAAAIYLIVGLLICAAKQFALAKPEMTLFAYIIITLCISMLFVPRMLAKK